MITSDKNPQVKRVQNLLKKAKLRNKEEVFVAEGLRIIQEIPEHLLIKGYVSKNFHGKCAGKIKKDFEYELVEDHVFKKMADTAAPQGVLAIVKQPVCSLDALLKKENPRFLVLENMQDPGNLGTVLRTAEGAGTDAVFLSRESVDVYNPKVVRSTMGTIFRLPFLYVDNLSELLSVLKKQQITIYAADLEESVPYDSPDYCKGTAFLIGNEGNGLTEEIKKKADQNIHIPMEGEVESLNAAVAASILMYEAYRQRRR